MIGAKPKRRRRRAKLPARIGGVLSMKLVVGLGNPGRRYQGTRHNIGWAVLAELARRFAAGRPKASFRARWSRPTWRARRPCC